jgi:hypothetical protein
MDTAAPNECPERPQATFKRISRLIESLSHIDLSHLMSLKILGKSRVGVCWFTRAFLPKKVSTYFLHLGHTVCVVRRSQLMCWLLYRVGFGQKRF